MNGQDVPLAAVHMAAIEVGSATAFGAGILAFAIPPIESPAMIVALGGLVTAISGFLGSLGNQFVAAYRIWAEQRRAERDRKSGLPALRCRLDAALDEIERLNGFIRDQARTYERLEAMIRRIEYLGRGDLQALAETKGRMLEELDPEDRDGRRAVELKAVLDACQRRLEARSEANGDDRSP